MLVNSDTLKTLEETVGQETVQELVDLYIDTSPEVIASKGHRAPLALTTFMSCLKTLKNCVWKTKWTKPQRFAQKCAPFTNKQNRPLKAFKAEF